MVDRDGEIDVQAKKSTLDAEKNEQDYEEAESTASQQPRIVINDVEYDASKISDEAKAIIGSLHFTEGRLNNLQNELAVCQTARQRYIDVLKAELIG